MTGGIFTMNLPVHPIVSQNVKIIFKRDGNSIWVDKVVYNDTDDFILGGAL